MEELQLYHLHNEARQLEAEIQHSLLHQEAERLELEVLCLLADLAYAQEAETVCHNASHCVKTLTHPRPTLPVSRHAHQRVTV